MPSATAVRARRRAPGAGNARVDWQHPYAHRLQGLWLPQGIARFCNLVNPSDALDSAGSTSITAGVTGWGVSAGETAAAPSARAFVNLAPSAALQPSGAVTMLWLGAISGNAGTTNRRLCGMEYNNADGSPFNVYGIYRDANVSTGVTFACDGGSAFSSTSSTPITNGPVDQTAFAVLTYNGSTLAGYWNGALVTSTAKSGALAYSATSFFCIGTHATSAVTGSNNAQCNMVAVWDRALSAEEIAELWSDPFQMLLTGGRRSVRFSKGQSGAAAQDIGASTGTITLSGVAGAITPASGPTIGAATGTITLTGVNGAITSGATTIGSATGIITLTGVAGAISPASGPTIGAATGTITLTGVAGAISFPATADPNGINFTYRETGHTTTFRDQSSTTFREQA